MRRLLLLGSAVVFIDVAFFEAIIPLLPDYADDLGLSKASAGILTAAYAAGTLTASLPAGLMAARFGPRPTLLLGLGMLGAASLVFGFGANIVLLDAARFVQGVAGALAWSGALSWLILAAPEERRGSVIGNVLGVAVAGALLGPALGALAHEIGTEAVFGSMLVITVALAIAARRIPDPPPGERQTIRDVVSAMLAPAVLRTTWYVAAPSTMFGIVAVLVPLRIDELGGGAGVVAAGFIAGAALEAVTAPLVGRLSDRVGRLRPYSVGMLVCAGAIALVPAVQVLGVLLAVLVTISLGAGICFAPSLAMLSDAADATRLHQGLAAGLINVAWASGQVAGSVGGGAAANAAGDAVPCLAASVLLVVTTAAALRYRA
jgi:MFS family permease